MFREREPPSVPTSAKRGFAKNFRVPGKKGERPESGFGSGNDQTPDAPEMPVPPSRSHFRSGFTSTPVLFPLLVPTSVPGFARCCLFRVPFPQRENPEVEGTPRGGAGKREEGAWAGLVLWLALPHSNPQGQPEYEARGHAKRRARHPLRMPATTWLAADTHTHLARLWLLLELDRQDMSASEQGRTRSKLRGTREGRALLVSAALSDWLRSAIGNHSNPGERIRSRPFHGRLSAPFLTPPRATVATFELVPQKALRGANRTSAVPPCDHSLIHIHHLFRE